MKILKSFACSSEHHVYKEPTFWGLYLHFIFSEESPVPVRSLTKIINVSVGRVWCQMKCLQDKFIPPQFLYSSRFFWLKITLFVTFCYTQFKKIKLKNYLFKNNQSFYKRYSVALWILFNVFVCNNKTTVVTFCSIPGFLKFNIWQLLNVGWFSKTK